MKKIFRILIIAFLVLNISIIYVHSETLNLIEEKLDSVGVPEEYSDNIINYINNLKLSEEETTKLLDEANDVILKIKDKKNYTFTDLINIYGEALNIADSLNINVDLNIANKEVMLKDKDSKLTLIKCNIDDVRRYYENYKKSPLTSQDYQELKSFIAENTITNEEDIEKDRDTNNLNNISDNNLNDKEIAKNNESSTSNYNSSENNDKTFNTVSAIRRKNVNRVLSIVFLVLFACVLVSLLIDSIFFKREK